MPFVGLAPVRPSMAAFMGECEINCLLYADDLILLSESEHGLQRCLDK